MPSTLHPNQITQDKSPPQSLRPSRQTSRASKLVKTALTLLLGMALIQPPLLLAGAWQAATAKESPTTTEAAPFSGDWQGSIQLPGQELNVTVHLLQAQKKWSGSIDIPQQQAKALPLSDIQINGQQITFKIAGVPGDPTFVGQLSDKPAGIQGDFNQGGQKFRFALKPGPTQAQQKVQATQNKAQDEKLAQELRELIKQSLAVWKTPGVAVAVIKDGKVLLSEGFGQRDQARQLPVTANTLFAIGSSTKAFTATALGMLVDQGKLDWDKPIHGFLPDFELQDPFATSQMSTRDLLTHRSGLPRHDVSWYGSDRTRQDLYYSLKYLQPTAPFRTRFQYQNLMFMTAGILLEKISGESWEDFVKENIFQPLGMKRSTTSSQTMQSDPDHSQPYALKADKATEIPFRPIDAVGPAGSIHSSISDMTQWLRFNLGNGSYEDTKGKPQRLLETTTLQEIHSPQMIVSNTGSNESPYMLYGMGWFIQPYRGHTLLQHGGNIDGFTAMVSLMPVDHLGVVILSNKNGDMLPTALMCAIDDKLLKLDPIDWNTRLKGHLPDEGMIKQVEFPQVQGTHPSHELTGFTGNFAHPAYGNLSIETRNGQLWMNYRDIGGTLKHWHYDSFKIENPDSLAKGQLVSFFTNELGDISALEMTMEPQAAPIRFEHQVDPSLSLPANLALYTGNYTLATTAIEVSLQGPRLMVHVAGQPTLELEPYQQHLFKLKGYPGFMARFVLEGDKVTAVELIQPNGVFRAEKNK